MSQAIIKETQLEWIQIYHAFKQNILMLNININNIDSQDEQEHEHEYHTVFMKCYEYIKNACDNKNYNEKNVNIQICFNCIRLLIRRGMIDITLIDSDSISKLNLNKYTISFVGYCIQLLTYYHSNNEVNKKNNKNNENNEIGFTSKSCSELCKCLIIIFGKAQNMISYFIDQNNNPNSTSSTSIDSYSKQQNGIYGSNGINGLKLLLELLQNKNCSVSVLFHIIRIFHFLEIR